MTLYVMIRTWLQQLVVITLRDENEFRSCILWNTLRTQSKTGNKLTKVREGCKFTWKCPVSSNNNAGCCDISKIFLSTEQNAYLPCFCQSNRSSTFHPGLTAPFETWGSQLLLGQVLRQDDRLLLDTFGLPPRTVQACQIPCNSRRHA